MDQEIPVKLEEWEEICLKCNGTGDWCNKNDTEHNYPEDIPCYLTYECSYSCVCQECKGTGKFDFIEKIVGKKSKSLDTTNLEKIWIDNVVKAIANKIDNEIINLYIATSSSDSLIEKNKRLYDYED